MSQAAQTKPFSFRVGILSHQNLFRAFLCEHLVSHFGATVAFECAAWNGFDESARAAGEVELLFVDGDLPDKSPRDWIQALGKGAGTPKTAVITDRPASYLFHLFLQFGLNGFLHKRDTIEVFHSAITAIMAGGIFVSPNVSVSQRNIFSRVLSDREADVLRSFALGQTPAIIGRALGISAETVLTHRRNCMRKLELNSELGLALFAVESGLVAHEQLGRTRKRKSPSR